MKKERELIESQDPDMPVDIVSDRGNIMKEVMVDVTKRDNPDGTFNFVILVYVRADINPLKIAGPLKKTCKTLFGKKKDSRYFETYFRPKNSVELATGEKGAFDTFDITIKHPRSVLYDLDGLKGVFMRELKRNMD